MTRKEYEKIYSKMTEHSISTFKRNDSVIMEDEVDVFDEGYSAEYSAELLEYFKSGNLHMYWFWKYPHLFDHDDLWTGCAVQRENGNHFGEWLGAIILNHHYKYTSLVEKYDCPGEHKQKIVHTKRLLGDDLYSKLITNESQPPDLLMHRDDDFFLCEIKRRNTSKKESTTPNQPQYFKWLKSETKKKVILLALIET
jgi:hypothetical protein